MRSGADETQITPMNAKGAVRRGDAGFVGSISGPMPGLEPEQPADAGAAS
jgi:hypothetical protein